MTNTQGKLFVFEGADAVGKSTLAEWFATYLRDSGAESTLLSFPGKEAGTLGQHIYDLHHDPVRFGIITAINAASIQLLHVAAHIDAIENRIKPLLNEGKTIILDRFWWSTFVYGLAAGVSRSVLDGMIEVERAIWKPVQPDRLFLVTRATPLRAEPEELWPRWRDAYLQLGANRKNMHPVVLVENEQDPSVARKRILESQ